MPCSQELAAKATSVEAGSTSVRSHLYGTKPTAVKTKAIFEDFMFCPGFMGSPYSVTTEQGICKLTLATKGDALVCGRGRVQIPGGAGVVDARNSSRDGSAARYVIKPSGAGRDT